MLSRGTGSCVWAGPDGGGAKYERQRLLSRQPARGTILRDLGLRVRHLGVGLGDTIQCLDFLSPWLVWCPPLSAVPSVLA